MALILMVLTEGQREEQGRDVRVGLRKPAGGVGENLEMRGGPVRLVKGQYRGRYRGPQRSGGT